MNILSQLTPKNLYCLVKKLEFLLLSFLFVCVGWKILIINTDIGKDSEQAKPSASMVSWRLKGKQNRQFPL